MGMMVLAAKKSAPEAEESALAGAERENS